MIILESCFFAAVGFIFVAYVLFPALVLVRGRLFPRAVAAADVTPAVSVVIACHNEEANIEGKLTNLLELDYPTDKLQLIVASDGSTDATERVVERYGDRVQLLKLPRQGKAAALNAAVAQATGDILVFSDANSMFDANALRGLVRPFADERVGGVAGDQRYEKNQSATSIQEGERRYWSFDRWLKRYQSRAGSVTSSTGAIHAVRRELFADVPGGVTDDFFISTQVVAAGYRLVFAEDAVAREPVAESGGAEFQRKVRLMSRGLRGVVEMRRLLNPFRYGFYSFQLFAHKVMRRLIVFALIVLAVTAPLLWRESTIYQLAVVAQVAFYAAALMAYISRSLQIRAMKAFSLPAFFVLANAAAFMATMNLLRGRTIEYWTPQRPQTPAQ